MKAKKEVKFLTIKVKIDFLTEVCDDLLLDHFLMPN